MVDAKLLLGGGGGWPAIRSWCHCDAIRDQNLQSCYDRRSFSTIRASLYRYLFDNVSTSARYFHKPNHRFVIPQPYPLITPFPFSILSRSQVLSFTSLIPTVRLNSQSTPSSDSQQPQATSTGGKLRFLRASPHRQSGLDTSETRHELSCPTK